MLVSPQRRLSIGRNTATVMLKSAWLVFSWCSKQGKGWCCDALYPPRLPVTWVARTTGDICEKQDASSSRMRKPQPEGHKEPAWSHPRLLHLSRHGRGSGGGTPFPTCHLLAVVATGLIPRIYRRACFSHRATPETLPRQAGGRMGRFCTTGNRSQQASRPR
jgi:hypothetical protein